MAGKSINLQEKADELIRMAEEAGVEQDFFFTTTFSRYKMQIAILTELAKVIRENDAIVTKEYVKGRENVMVHPAIREYNKTVATANQTVGTLLKIITTLADHSIADSARGDEEL